MTFEFLSNLDKSLAPNYKVQETYLQLKAEGKDAFKADLCGMIYPSAKLTDQAYLKCIFYDNPITDMKMHFSNDGFDEGNILPNLLYFSAVVVILIGIMDITTINTIDPCPGIYLDATDFHPC
jgi:hypothetical protein